MIRRRPTRSSTRWVSTSATRTASACCRMAAPPRSSSRSAGESTLETDVLELVADHWRKVGIELFTRTTPARRLPQPGHRRPDDDVDLVGHRQRHRHRRHESRRAGADDGSQLQWPQWGMYYESRGERVRRPTFPRRRSWSNCSKKWRLSGDGGRAASASGTKCWRSIPTRCFRSASSIRTLQPIVASDEAEKHARSAASYSFDPTSYFGVYHADTFWLDEGRPVAMLRYILWRIAVMVPTLLIISALIFTIIELPPGDYFESYIAELQAQGESVNIEQIEALRKEYGFDKPPVLRYFHWLAGMLPGRFRLFLRISAAGHRRGRRPAMAHRARVLRHHHFHLARRLSDRHLFGDPSIQLERLRADLPRPARPRHSQFHAGAGLHVFRQYLVRHLHRPPDGPAISSPSR